MTPLEMLWKFTSDEQEPESRKFLLEPFTQGDYTLASNGAVIVRVPKLDGPPVVTNPNALKLFEDAPAHIGDAAAIMVHDYCGTCKGTLRATCDMGHEHDCDDGDVRIGVAVVDSEYALLIASLPNVVIHEATEPFAAIPFRFDGGDGLLMPMKPKMRYEDGKVIWIGDQS